jgi:hypothetical protein
MTLICGAVLKVSAVSLFLDKEAGVFFGAGVLEVLRAQKIIR